MFDLDGALRETVRIGASDLHLKVPAVPHARLEGELVPLDGHPQLTPADTEEIKERLLKSEVKREQFARQGYADFSYYLDESRFRVGSFSQRGSASFVFRVIPDAPTPEGLGIPDVVLSWADAPRGLVLVTGPTGAGKSTTSAVLIGLINERRHGHIVTIEDPIEFIHRDRQAIISQREIGLDAESNRDALRGALRQDADVILIGEVRDEDTAVTAMRAAETGHLVICTLHTNDAPETVQRLIDLFDPRQQVLARQMLASTLVGSVSQRLIPGVDGKRFLNTEVMVSSARVQDMIVDGRPSSELHEAVAEGDYYGMHSFDQDLLAHVEQERLSTDDAFAWATSPHDLKLMMSGNVPGRRQRTAA